MTLFLTYLIASTFGTLTGGIGLMYLAGWLAKKAEIKRRKEFEVLAKHQLEEINKKLLNEIERMKKYAEMEG